jgi:hypothetical protein
MRLVDFHNKVRQQGSYLVGLELLNRLSIEDYPKCPQEGKL